MCVSQKINTHRTSPVNTIGSVPCLLPCRYLKSSWASWNTFLAHTPACTACFKKWKILSLRTWRGSRRCWIPVALRTSFIPSCFAWTRQDLPQMGVRGGKGGDGNHNDIELISLGVITCFLNAEIFPWGLARKPRSTVPHHFFPMPPQAFLPAA